MEKEVELGSLDVEVEMATQPQRERLKGGLVTMPFIIANEALARLASLGLLPNMIQYLMGTYKLHLSTATQILLLTSASTNFTPVLAAFIADSYLGRFLAVGIGSAISFLGMTLLWLTAMIPGARPPNCSQGTESCKSATAWQMTILISAFALMSIGNGGLSCSLAFGADQVNRKDNPNNRRVLEMFFSWFLNRACVIKDPGQDVVYDGSASNPWRYRLCTVDQVEELKAIIKVIPLWSTGIMMSVNIGGSFGLLQAKSLDRHITSHFQVPPGSFSVIMIVTIFLWIALYDRVLLPVASKIRGKPVRINAKRRMGLGLFFSFLHLITSAIVETVRRRRAVKEGYLNNANGVLRMSAMWLFPQLCLGGIAEAFNAIGQNEFYYTEFPRSMSSVAASLSGLGMAAGNLVSSLVFSMVQNITARGGKEGWVLDNINKGRYDNYFWVISGLSALNLVYYLICSWAYGPTIDQLREEENGSRDQASTDQLRNGDEVDKQFHISKMAQKEVVVLN